MMSDAQLRGMHLAGMEIGAHTAEHPILAVEDDAGAEKEIAAGRQVLQQLIDQSVDLFAYPNGQPGQDYDLRHVAMVEKLGFKAAVSTAAGAVTANSPIFQMPRFTPWDMNQTRWLARMIWMRTSRLPAAVA
jgi:peptidoglycan/xylan/chitin deacetylase (PgdA/CDA1 family)